MKRVLGKITRGTALVVVLSLGFFLVATSILKSIGWSLPDMMKDAVTSISEMLMPRDSSEVQNYVLFTEVEFGNRQVITGIKYTSTSGGVISSQWCYLSGNGKSGEAISRLELASISKAGAKATSPITTSALSQFGLTTSSAKALVKSHCRFQ